VNAIKTFSTSRRSPDSDIRIIHTSDVHVDDDYTADAWGGDGNGGLLRVLNAARRAEADLVLLVGDTFECNRLPLAVVRRTAEILAEARIPVVILPGNHDPATADSPFHYGGVAAVENVAVLGITHDPVVHFPGLDLEVWGRAHMHYGDMDPLGFAHARTARWGIAMAHGHFTPAPDRSTNIRPSWLIGDDEILAHDAHYLALGHWNRPIQVGAGPTPAYYSGSPDYAQTVNLVRLKADGAVEVTREPLEM
jgi:DNA repair exonuclease SbcCD nuclease subunit